MTILEFYETTVLKTILITEDQKYNKAHMALGLVSELTSEFIEANINNDIVNMREELGDAEWFILGWAMFEELTIPNVNHLLGTVKQRTESNTMFEQYVLINIGNLATVVKNEIIKDKPKLNGIILTKENKQELFENILFGIEKIAKNHGIDMVEVRQLITKKLNIRYNGGGFSAEKSLDRDLESERKALEDNNQTIIDFGD